MDRAIYIAMTGAKNNMLSQTAHSNNLANAQTTGFKADWAQARSMPVFGEHHPTRAYALSERPATDFNDGPMISTNHDLDLAIAGDGYFSVNDEQGNEVLTRRGDLRVNADGALLNGEGLQLFGEGGPIVLPPFDKVEITNDGTISIRPPGSAPNALVIVDRIKLSNPDFRNLEKGTDGLFRKREEDGQGFAQDDNLRVRSGFIEGSNVNAVAELTNILSLSRQYEIQIKLMKAAEEVSQASEQLLQLN
jgi:flagellar basal-body rod protein FlgF